jgi:CBS domain-containing protein
MPVADVMTSRLVAAAPDDTVVVAVRRMVDAGVGAVLVCEGTRLAGIFTERDVLRLVAEGLDLASTPLGDVMTRQVVTVDPDDDVVAVAHTMAERAIRRAPVTLGDDVLGVIGIRDVMRVLLERAYDRHDADAHDTARDLLRPPVSSEAREGA